MKSKQKKWPPGGEAETGAKNGGKKRRRREKRKEKRREKEKKKRKRKRERGRVSGTGIMRARGGRVYIGKIQYFSASYEISSPDLHYYFPF